MAQRPPEDEYVSYSVELGVEAPLRFADEADYIAVIEGKILRHDVLPTGEPAPTEVIGTIKAHRIYGGRAMNDRYSLWDVCNAHEQETSDCYAILFSESYDYIPVIEEMFPEAFSPDVLLIDLVRVRPAFRGRDLGLLAARRVIDMFEPEDGLVVVKPFPLQFNAPNRSHRTKDEDLSGFVTDEVAAFDKLRRYWARLGFRQVGDTEYLALSPALITPSIRDLDPG